MLFITLNIFRFLCDHTQASHQEGKVVNILLIKQNKKVNKKVAQTFTKRFNTSTILCTA